MIQHPNPLVGVPRFSQRDSAQLVQRDRTCFSSSFAHAAMEARNREQSATLARDPTLQRHNRTSYPLNKLWYLSERRRRRDPRGGWRSLWLAQWCDDPPTP